MKSKPEVAHENPDAAAVLAKAVLRAGSRLGMSQAELAAVLGVSGASVSRLVSGRRGVDPASKEGELALLFVRLFRSLDTLVGGSETASREWMHAENSGLGGVPVRLVRTVRGLVDVGEYLDGMRGNL